MYGFTAVATSLPAGCTVMELKQCENCPASFTRARGSGLRFCGPCKARMLMPDRSLEQHKELLPDSHRSDRLPRYDDSLDPVFRRERKKYGDWRLKVAQAFIEQPVMSVVEIGKVIGCASPRLAGMLCRNGGVKLELVASVWPSRKSGVAPKMYRYKNNPLVVT